MQAGAEGGGAEQGVKFWRGSFLSRAVFMDLRVKECTLVLEEGVGHSLQTSGSVLVRCLLICSLPLCLPLSCRI